MDINNCSNSTQPFSKKKSFFTSHSILTLQTKLRNSKPFPHIILKNFLPKPQAIDLLKALKHEPFELKQSDLFCLYQTKDLISSTNQHIQQFRTFLASKAFTNNLTKITNIKLIPNTIDMAGTIYIDTNYLLPHDDQLEGRKIAYIYYLSTLTKNDGGALAFYNSKHNQPISIVKRTQPTFNTLLLFPVTTNSFHEVEEIITNTQRIAISGWFHG
ncbi:MAG: hypothetical protein A3D39_00625 [Candidatus Buchananbacteria bacterium RIFCSPHIGHO2_02_FULL_39_17]|uniref:Prolyl 4-hydroxylase alpha subunit domain-containing protein n=1 Tax=Candidatus Buchananbacteria bacterium RIFCSPLOWO2_01_FULL_40_23b TaxID=1797544 RepID=A0A1G1YLI6_9BACT|nr:MAG: hypothetical protein A3D39_00625 [Candidatus Buchananbacteria bacterium RIFCSPHIGHO2_02_FULL_39_17]OGY53169.1 MAG: hypothetical protein A2912_04305 [Candidatus Buchananbacteria bacterium RIFCSPLOWO2_01_FULL_40_23b]